MNPQIKKTFDHPDETRPIKKGKVEILNMAPGLPVMRTTFEPGWKWSECVKPVAGTDSCQVPHLVYVVSGRWTTDRKSNTAPATWGWSRPLFLVNSRIAQWPQFAPRYRFRHRE
jgi:hypothetical protein